MSRTAYLLVLFILCLILVVESFLQQPLNILVSELFKRRSDQARYVVPPKSRAGRTRQPNDQTSNPRSPTTSEASSSRKQEISSPKPRSFAMKNIQGQNTIICREFKIDSPKTFDFLGSFRSSNQLPIYPLPEIAFIGRSNVGKSSLINCLTNLNKKVVITSKTPGRTQGINLIKCNDREGDICVLADLPGYGFAKISKELQREISNFVNEYIMQRDALRLCIVLLDARREPLESDYNTLKSLAENGIPFTIVLTKSDLVSKTELPKVIKKIQELYALPEGQPVAFSATTGAGRKDVWRLIKEGILDDGSEEDEDDDGNNLGFEIPDFSGIRSSK